MPLRNMSDNNKQRTDIDKEVNILFNEGYNLDSNLLSYLRTKYNDNKVVETILNNFKLKKRKLEKYADKFINKFNEKYGEGTPMNVIYRKILKYKKKYNLTDEEFDYIKINFERKLYDNKYEDFEYADGSIAKTLGAPFTYNKENLHLSHNNDYRNIQEIIKLNNLSKPLYSHVLLQSSLFTHHKASDIMQGSFIDNNRNPQFNADKHNPLVHIHPVLVALFSVRITNVDKRMLYSNIAELVQNRYEKKPIYTAPNNELFYFLWKDNNDVVCSEKSALDDLRERAAVQIQLWQNVFNLRNGKFFEQNSIDFLNVVDKCKVSNYDNPDLIILGDEGVLLRRLFNVFSFRPILVQTMPFVHNFVNNPYNMYNTQNMYQLIPYITKRIVPEHHNIPNVTNPLKNCIDVNETFTQYYFENKTFVLKHTSILDVSGPLVFYVPRKAINVPVVMPPSVRQLPLTKFNNFNINTEVMDINVKYNNLNLGTYCNTLAGLCYMLHNKNNCKYILKSVVFYNKFDKKQYDNKDNNTLYNISTYVSCCKNNDNKNSSIFCYNPSILIDLPSEKVFKKLNYQNNDDVCDSINEKCKKYGTVFIFDKDSDDYVDNDNNKDVKIVNEDNNDDNEEYKKKIEKDLADKMKREVYNNKKEREDLINPPSLMVSSQPPSFQYAI